MSELKTGHSEDVEVVYWQDVREQVKAVNHELFEIFESIDPGKDLPFVYVHYRYGKPVVHQGQVMIPIDDEQLLPSNSVKLDPRLVEYLNYSPIPLGVIINKNCEVFVNACQRTVPLNILTPGEIFGVYEILDLFNNCAHQSMCSLSAGTRSAFMLPKITDTSGNKRIKKEFGINHHSPKSLNEHWITFSNIVNQKQFDNYWSCDILYLSRAWVEQEPDNINWLRFRHYLYQHGWQQSSYARQEETCAMIIQALVLQALQKNMRPKMHVLDHLKQLVSIATSTVPGFTPTGDDESSLPTRLLKKVYVDIYGLKQYFPTIMQPALISQDKIVYYSLAHPTMMECALTADNPQALMSDQRDIKYLLENLYHNFSEQINNEISIVRNELIRSEYDFYHGASDPYSEIKPSRLLPDSDPRLISDSKIYQDRSFCASSPFLSACIQISLKENRQVRMKLSQPMRQTTESTAN